MPTLNWMGKEKVVNHHRDVPYRVLERVPEKGVLDSRGSDCGNMIIHGDNLEALKALLPEYEGKVDCIYIDPPYNTGNEGWVYNDNVNDPRIRKWLGQVVGKEGEDFSRHDKWLCMMYPRLQLLRKLLAPTGVIFISIDDVEATNLKLILDEIFGVEKFICQFVWKSRQNKDNRNISGVSVDHEYVFCYGHKLRGAARDTSQYSNPDNDPRGAWASANMVGLATAEQRPNLHYDLIDPATGINYGCPLKGWRYDRNSMARLIEEDRIIWPASPSGRPRKKQYLAELDSLYTGFSSIVGEDCYTSSGTKELRSIFGSQVFDFPKCSAFVGELVEQATCKPESIVLDSFAGSGTTAHAVLNLNRQDGLKRKFILVEMGEYADDVTAERTRRVIGGYGNDPLTSPGIDSGFSYYELGPALFDVEEPPISSKSATPMISLNADVPTDAVRRYVWHTETRAEYVDRTGECPWLLGEHAQAAYYLVYVPGEETVLDYDLLGGFPVKGSPTVVYANRCALSPDQLEAAGVAFKQIPSQIARM